jgi:hypothetical protein
MEIMRKRRERIWHQVVSIPNNAFVGNEFTEEMM